MFKVSDKNNKDVTNVALVSSLLALTNFALFSNTSNLEFALVNAGRVLTFPEEYNYLQDRSP